MELLPLVAWLAVQSAPIDSVTGPADTATVPLPPEQRLVPVPATHVTLREEAFFAPWFRRNLETSLIYGHEQLEKHGQFKNFRLAAGTEKGEYSGVHFYDSDAFKWLEAASMALARGPDPKLQALEILVDRFIAEIAAAQEPDGYLQTEYTFKKKERWSKLQDDHELYCAGHLIQAAIAHHEATGKTTLYDVALKFADCIDRTFGSGPGKRPGCCGHPEIETALVQLYLHSGEKRWLDLAKFFLEERGQKPPRAGGDFYRQDDKPIREQKTAAGHAVRQLYLCSGMVGVAAETGDRGLFDAALAISRDIDACKLYVTGGVGARHDGEAFGQPFELPNESAYAETCASIALMRFSNELLALTGRAEFADRVENTLYNAFLAAIGADGTSFFYVNPLESKGGKQRQPWFWCACCPPNVMRTLAGLPGWFASTTKDALFLHQYDAIDVDTRLGDGREVGLRVETTYPWTDPATGKSRIAVHFTKAPEGESTLALRKPAWAKDEFDWFVDEGEKTTSRTSSGGCNFQLSRGEDGWLRMRGKFKVGHRVVLDLAPRPEFVRADSRVVDNRGKVALRAGPVVYAFESIDQPVVDLFSTTLSQSSEPERGNGSEVKVKASETKAGLTAIPYHQWANRGDSKLRLWMPAIASGHEPGAPPAAKASKQGAKPQDRPEAVFSLDVAFLREHADAIVLQAPGAGPVAVSPKLSGRVMTSAFAEQEPGFGLVVREAVSQPPPARGFANYGGEDRLWFAPEGGPYGLFFDVGAKQELENWYVPRSMDGGPRTVVAQDATSVTFRDRAQLANVKGVKFDLSVERRIDALGRDAVAKLLAGALPAGLPADAKLVAFRSTNTLKNESATPLSGDAVIAAWILGQFKPSPQNHVLVPFRGSADAIKDDYFGVVPPGRLSVATVPGTDGGVARFKGDAQFRSKIGVSAAGSTGWLGAWDDKRRVLTLVQHTVSPADAIVPDCNWIDPNPRAKKGDVATSYNHGEEPRFFELESISAALPAKPGGSVTHVHTTIHLAGDDATLGAIAAKLLHASLADRP